MDLSSAIFIFGPNSGRLATATSFLFVLVVSTVFFFANPWIGLLQFLFCLAIINGGVHKIQFKERALVVNNGVFEINVKYSKILYFGGQVDAKKGSLCSPEGFHLIVLVSVFPMYFHTKYSPVDFVTHYECKLEWIFELFEKKTGKRRNDFFKKASSNH